MNNDVLNHTTIKAMIRSHEKQLGILEAQIKLLQDTQVQLVRTLKDTLDVINKHELRANNVEGVLHYHGIHWKNLQQQMREQGMDAHAVKENMEQIGLNLDEPKEANND